jgi:uncharacterized protein
LLRNRNGHIFLISLREHLKFIKTMHIAPTFIWYATDYHTTEQFSLSVSATPTAKGLIIGEADGQAVHIEYEVEVDAHWQVSHAIVKKNGMPFLNISRKSDGRWFNHEGQHLSRFDDCIDIDLSLTPFTNTLPIKRLGLQKQQSADINVVYIDLIGEDLYPAPQRYTRMGDHHYHFKTLDYEFHADLVTDDDGWVVYYSGLWERVYPSQTAFATEREVLLSDLRGLQL